MPDALGRQVYIDEEGHARTGPGGKLIEAEKRDAVTVGKPVTATRVTDKDGKNPRILLEDGSMAPEHIQAAGIPPSYKDIKVYLDPTSDVFVEATAVAKDKTERPAKLYNKVYEAEQEAAKYTRVKKMLEESKDLDDQIKRASKDKATKEEAECTLLMKQQATRPGSETDTKRVADLYGRKMKPENVVVTPQKDKKGKELPPKVEIEIDGRRVHVRDRAAAEELMRRKASGKGLEDSTFWLKSHGATTLEARHVVEDKDGLHLRFMGKEGVWHDHVVSDKATAAMLRRRVKESKKRGGKLFDTDEKKVNKFIETKLDDARYSSKDFRTKRANEIALAEMKKFKGKKPKTLRERKQWIKQVATAASKVLGNQPGQCVKSYINPTVWDVWPKPEK